MGNNKQYNAHEHKEKCLCDNDKTIKFNIKQVKKCDIDKNKDKCHKDGCDHGDHGHCGCHKSHDHHDHHDHHDCHDHGHSDSLGGCTCGHDHEKSSLREHIPSYVIGGVLLLVAIIGELGAMKGWISAVLSLLVYVYFGKEVFIGAYNNIKERKFFTEYTLMLVASVGAIALLEFAEAAAVIYLYSLGEEISGEAYSRSRKNISDLIEITEDNVTLIKDGVSRVIPASEAEIGDVISVRVGDKIALDGVVVSGNGFADTSAITGEGAPRELFVGAECLSGFLLVSGAIFVRVTEKHENSTAAKLKDAVKRASAEKAVTEKRITKFASVFTPIAFLVSVAVLILGLFIKDSFGEAFKSALVVLVASCPCSLVLSVPLTYFSGIGRAAKRGIVFRGGQVIDSTSHLKTVVFDKTGTLTEAMPDFLGVVEVAGAPVDKITLLNISKSALINSPHASAKAFCNAYTAPVRYDAQNVKNIGGMGLVCTVEGKKALFGNKRLMEKAGVSVKETKMSAIHIAIDGVYCGALVFGNKIKKGALAEISKLRRNGVERVAIMSGDNMPSVKKLADEIAIEEFYYELKPDEKLAQFDYIYKEEKNRNSRGTVAFCGDGLNDSAVIAKADVGIAMGSGSALTVENADVVIVDDSLERLPDMLFVAKSTSRVAVENIALSLGVKIAVIILGMTVTSSLGLAVIADVGTTVFTVLNAMRAGKLKK